MPALYRRDGGPPALLPFSAIDANGDNWTDLENNPPGRAACGFVLAPAQPGFDPATQAVRWDNTAEAWRVEALPPAPPSPAPAPAILGKLAFIALAQSAGGMSDAQLLAAHADPAFAALWLKFSMASEVERNHPVTEAALSALDAAGYLPNHAAAVIAAWPTKA